MWNVWECHWLKVCCIWCPLSKDFTRQFASELLIGFPWADGKDRKDEKGKYLESIANQTPMCAMGFSVYASCRIYSKLDLKIFLKDSHIGFCAIPIPSYSWENGSIISGNLNWSHVVKDTHPFPPNWTYLWNWTLSLHVVSRRWKDAVRLECWFFFFFFVISASKYLFESEMTHWIMRSLSVRSIWPGQSPHFSQKNVYLLKKCVSGFQ